MRGGAIVLLASGQFAASVCLLVLACLFSVFFVAKKKENSIFQIYIFDQSYFIKLLLNC